MTMAYAVGMRDIDQILRDKDKRQRTMNEMNLIWAVVTMRCNRIEIIKGKERSRAKPRENVGMEGRAGRNGREEREGTGGKSGKRGEGRA